MTEFFLKIYDRLSGHRWLAWLLLGILIAVSVVMLSRMHYNEDISAFLPQNEESRKYSSVYRKLGGQDRIAVFFSVRDSCRGLDSTALIIGAMERFGELWEEADTGRIVDDMEVGIDQTRIMDVAGFLMSNAPYFLDEGDYARMDSLLSSPGYIRARLKSAKEMLMFPSSSFTSVNLKHDPLGLFSPLFLRLKELDVTGRNEVIDGHLFFDGGRKGAVFFTSPYGESESGMNAGLSAMLDNVMKQTEAECDNISITATGGPLIAVTNATRIKKDSIMAVSIAVILIFLILILSFRNFRDILWTGFSLLCGTIFSLGLIAVFKDSISIIILGIGSVIIGIAANYPLHYIDHLKHQPDTRAALKDMVSPLLTGNITTVCAFLSLLLLRAEALRDFGTVSALMLTGTILFVIIFLPVLMRSDRTRSRKSLNLDLGRAVPQALGRRMLVPFLAVTVVLAVFSFRIEFDSDIRNINYMTCDQRDGLALLASSAEADKGLDMIYAVTEAPDTGSALAANEKLVAGLRKSGNISGISTISDIVPSSEKQARRLGMWEEFWEKHPGTVPELVREAALAGFSPNAFRPFINNVQQAHEIRDAGFFSPLLGSVGKASVLDDGSGVTVVNYVKVPEQESRTLKETWRQEIGENSFVFDSSDVGNQLVGLLSEDFDSIGFICGCIVFFFLWLSFGRLELSLLSFLPLAVGWIWILGIMQIAGLQFNIVNIILATFIFGQGDDYTIFITEGLMYEYTYGKKILSSYKSSVALSAIIMFIGIGTLILARHPAMKSLAEVTMVGMATVVLMAYYLPPLVFRWLTEKDGVRREVPLTLKRLCLSVFSFISFLLMIAVAVPCTRLYFIKDSEKKRERFHIFLQKLSRFIATHIPGAGYRFNNIYGETFTKPAVIICNHQSHLDVMYLLMLSPKIVILTNDWAWNNPFYKWIIRYAGFLPVSEGIDACIPKIRDIMEKGYSVVVFPEGTRSEDCSIGRFHRGAFHIAEQLGADILPVFIHGAGHVLPKKDFMLREGRIYVETGRRVAPDDPCWGSGFRERTKAAGKYYREHFMEICMEQEDADYNLRHVRYRYLYKSDNVRRHVSRELCRKNVEYVKHFPSGCKSVYISGSGAGAFAMLLAMSRRGTQVLAYESDRELSLAGRNCSVIPDNLHFLDGPSGEAEMRINLNEL